MRYLLLFLLLALQTSVFGYSANNHGKNDVQKTLVSAKRDLNARSFLDFAYAGQYQDVETNLSYNRFRYYSPESGTYISQDPIGLAGGMPNMYSYVFDLNSHIDPYGLMDVFDIAFSQSSISDVIADGPRAGELVDDLIDEAIDLGRLPDGLTLNVMELNGGRDIVTLNNRTLYIAQQAGLENIHPNFQDNINKLNKLLDGGMPLPLGEQPKIKPCK